MQAVQMLTGSAQCLLAVQLHLGDEGTDLERFLELAGSSTASTAATAAGAASLSRSRLAPEACTTKTAMWRQQAVLPTLQAAWSTKKCGFYRSAHTIHVISTCMQVIAYAALQLTFDLPWRKRH